jgi:hypothetical protein
MMQMLGNFAEFKRQMVRQRRPALMLLATTVALDDASMLSHAQHREIVSCSLLPGYACRDCTAGFRDPRRYGLGRSLVCSDTHAVFSRFQNGMISGMAIRPRSFLRHALAR